MSRLDTHRLMEDCKRRITESVMMIQGLISFLNSHCYTIMLEVFGTLQVRLVSLASDSENRTLMDSNVLCCSFLENEVQIL